MNLVVIPLLVRLVPACSKGGCGPVILQEETARFTEEELAAAAGPTGELTAQACETLCELAFGDVDSVEGCKLADETRETTGDTGAPEISVACRFNAPTPCKDGRHHVAVLDRPAARGPCALGVWLADTALAEATSIQAFLSVATELQRFGAPEALIAGARAAARDEVIHARLFGRLAGRQGVRVQRPTFGRTPDRSLRDFAIENAVEGCVHETWAALMARVQAADAQDPEIRAACGSSRKTRPDTPSSRGPSTAGSRRRSLPKTGRPWHTPAPKRSNGCRPRSPSRRARSADRPGCLRRRGRGPSTRRWLPRCGRPPPASPDRALRTRAAHRNGRCPSGSR